MLMVTRNTWIQQIIRIVLVSLLNVGEIVITKPDKKLSLTRVLKVAKTPSKMDVLLRCINNLLELKVV